MMIVCLTIASGMGDDHW
jgi:hypothetical protein